MSKNNHSYKYYYQRAVIFLFTLGLFLPAVWMIIAPFKTWSEVEKRALATLPELPDTVREFEVYFPEVENFLNDHFGFREFLISRYQGEMDDLFDQTGGYSRVLKGLDGWYFFTSFKLLEDFRGEIPLSEQDLLKWKKLQQQRYQWLSSLGIEYILVPTPNKQSIYPEYLMKYALSARGTSRYQQLLKSLDDNSPPYFVDIHNHMLKAKSKGALYFKNDSHWNIGGAMVAYEAITDKLKSLYPKAYLRRDFTFAEDKTGLGGNTGQGGDLAVIMMKRKELVETYPVLKRYRSSVQKVAISDYSLSDLDPSWSRRSFGTKCKTANLKAIVFRDSFSVQLTKLLSESFSEVVYLWKEYDEKNVEEILKHYKPDVVIDIRVERHLFEEVAPVIVKTTGRSQVVAQ